MASHTCDQCGAIVARDEQFCPSCGSFIDPMTTPPPPRPRRSSGSVISVTSDGSYEEFSLASPPPERATRATQSAPADSAAGDRGQTGVNCPSCGASNPANNRHCQECGARLQQGPLPTAPRPAVQATAGVRAALAISGLLFGVVLFALLFNVFTGDDPGAGTSTTFTDTSSPVVAAVTEVAILEEVCTPQGISNFACSNLTSGSADEYQITWEDLAEGDTVTIELRFLEPIAVIEIRWRNIDDETRFHQNYRAKGLTVEAEGNPSPVPVELRDERGTQSFDFSALNTTEVTITIESVYQAEVRDGNKWSELAIDEIIVFGRPVIGGQNVTSTTSGSTTTSGG